MSRDSVRVDALNAAAALAVLALASWASLRGDETPAQQSPASEARPAASVQSEPLPGGGRGLRDATGALVPLRDYQRIASGSVVADELLLELCDADRIVSFTREGRQRSPLSYRYRDKPALGPLSDVEALLELRPDLLLVHNMGHRDRVTRLRERGVEVFDLGNMHGLSTLLPNIHSVALLVGEPERGAQLATRLQRRLARVAADIEESQRRKALYVGVHGDKLYGGTRGSSYHDMLRHAGLRDAAAGRFQGWPRYTPEDLLALDPGLVVTQRGMAAVLCRRSGLDALDACGEAGRIVEMPPGLLLYPGPVTLLRATEFLREAVYGASPRQATP